MSRFSVVFPPGSGPRRVAFWVVLAALVSAPVALAVDAPAPDWATGKTRGFAFTYFWFQVYEGANDCPDGYSLAMRDLAIKDLPQAEQERLLRPENRSEYY